MSVRRAAHKAHKAAVHHTKAAVHKVVKAKAPKVKHASYHNTKREGHGKHVR